MAGVVVPATVVGVSICYLAIDVGGVKLAAAVVSEQGEVLVRDRIATPQREVWPALSRLVLRVMAAAPTPPVGCGVGCGGPMNPAERTVSPLYIPSWKAFPLAAEVEALTQLPTVVDNNGKSVALGEAWCGAAVGLTDFVAVVMGAGVGGGIISGGAQGRDAAPRLSAGRRSVRRRASSNAPASWPGAPWRRSAPSATCGWRSSVARWPSVSASRSSVPRSRRSTSEHGSRSPRVSKWCRQVSASWPRWSVPRRSLVTIDNADPMPACVHSATTR